MQTPETKRKDSKTRNIKSTMITLNSIMIWIPMAIILGLGMYTSIFYSDAVDSGMGVGVIALELSPLLIIGIFVAIATLVWQTKVLWQRFRTLDRYTLVFGILWALLSLCYLGMWAWLIPQICGNFVTRS